MPVTAAAYDHRGHQPPIDGSSDPAFRGDPARGIPRTCCWPRSRHAINCGIQGLCARTGISVVSYRDDAEATMAEDPNRAGRFVNAALRPKITIQAGSDLAVANRLHHDAHTCFIANSVNFPISCEPVITFT
jgi:hypothetical protein